MDRSEEINLDEIYLEEIKTNTIKNQRKNKKIRVIHFQNGDSIEVDESDNHIILNEYGKNKMGIEPKKIKLFQLRNSPNEKFSTLGNIGKKTVNFSQSVSKKTLKTVDLLGETIANIIGITDSKFSNEINSGERK